MLPARKNALFTIFVMYFGHAVNAPPHPEAKGIIGRMMIDGVPVIYKLVDETPTDNIKAGFPWLTVIAWPYDGARNNGMPGDRLLEQMDLLERRLEKPVDDGHSIHAYSRTGKGLKELVYYVHDRDEFIDALNAALGNDPRYPISIDFHEDESWKDFEDLRSSFHSAPASDQAVIQDPVNGWIGPGGLATELRSTAVASARRLRAVFMSTLGDVSRNRGSPLSDPAAADSAAKPLCIASRGFVRERASRIHHLPLAFFRLLNDGCPHSRLCRSSDVYPAGRF